MSKEKIASRRQLLQLVGMLPQSVRADLPADIAQEWIDDPAALQQFMNGLRDGTCSITEIKTRVLEVTIDPKRTVEEWVKAGNYNYANPSLTTANFGQFLTVRQDGTEPYKAKVVAFCLGRAATIERAKRTCLRLGLKPIGFEHEAAVGEQHPELQRELTLLVNPDAVWVHPDLYRDVSCLAGHPDYRSFDLGVAGYEWDDRTWFFGLSE